MMPVQVVANGFGERDICALQQIESCLGIEYLALGKHCCCKDLPVRMLRDH